MQIASVRVQHFRAIADATMRFNSVTRIIGDNNAGKSAFLHALDLFFGTKMTAAREDFRGEDTSHDIEITVRFINLTAAESEYFQANIENDILAVTRIFSQDSGKTSGSFYSEVKGCPEFQEVREETGAQRRREVYKGLQEKYELPNVSKADAIDAALEQWESEHEDQLSNIRKPFRGFTNVGAGAIRERTGYVFVRAAKDASDFIGEKKSPIAELLDTISRQTIENKSEFQQLRQATEEKLREITDPSSIEDLAKVNGQVTEFLKKYYLESEVEATWEPVGSMPVSFPTARLTVKDHGHCAGVDRIGHGLQRAVILAIVEYLAESGANVDGKEEFSEAQSDIILAIEEPEAFQHPVKQRLFSELLHNLSLAYSKKTGIRFQIVFVTHSPLFVDMAKADEVRRVARITGAAPQETAVYDTTLGMCSEMLCQYLGKPIEEKMPDSVFATKLDAFTLEVAEGFFAKAVILVEGPSDKAILEGWFRANDRPNLPRGIVIAHANSKTQLDKPFLIFRNLGIPAFLIFDNDEDKGDKGINDRIRINKLLQRCAGVEEGECVEWPVGVFKSFAATENDLEHYLRSTVGDESYFRIREECAALFEVELKDCTKNAAVASAMITRFHSEGGKFELLDQIETAVLSLM